MKRLLFILFALHFSLLTSFAQGYPFLRNYSSEEYQAHDINYDINIGKDGLVFAANFEGLLYFDNHSWLTLHIPDNTRVTVTYGDKDGTIWVGGYNFFGRIDNSSNGQPTLKRIGGQDLFRGEVLEIWERDGLINFLVNDGKVYQVKGEKAIVRKVVSLEEIRLGMTDVVSAEAIENQSDVEVLTDIFHEEPLGNGLMVKVKKGHGLIIANDKGQDLYSITEKNGLPTNNVTWVSYNGHGVLWGSTENGIFSIGIPSAYSHFADNEGLKGDVFSIEEYENQKYVGTVNGLYRMEGMSFVNVGNIRHVCWAFAKSSLGLLAATSNGIYCIAPNGSVRQFSTSSATALFSDGTQFYSAEIDGVYLTQTNNLSRKKICDLDKVTKILKDSQGTIWVQSMYGDIWYKTMRDQNFKPYKKTSKEDIATLVQTKQKIYYVKSGEVKPFPYPQFSLTDKNGVTWLTNYEGKGLYRWKDEKRLTDLDQLLYPLSKYTIHAIYIKNDEVWFGTDQGLVVVKTSMQDPALLSKPKLLMRKITMGKDSLLWGGFGEAPTKLPILSSSNRNLLFCFSIDYEPLVGENVYRHQLNDGEWSAWADDHDAEYLNLPYGDYTFRVQGRDAFGRETDVTEISFRIDYPFYMKWYMNIVYMIIIGFTIAQIVQWRLHKLKEDKLRLEKIVEERTDEVKRAHKELMKQEKMATVGKLTQGLIDRILNPLNYINNFSKLSEGLVKDIEANIENEKDRMNEDNYEDTMDVLGMLTGNLQKVSEHGQNTTRTLKAMEEMLKDRSGGIVKMDLCPVLHQNKKMVNTYFHQDIQKHKISISFDYPDTPLYVKGNPELLSKTFMSLLGNSIYAVMKKVKQTTFEPEVSLKVSADNETITLLFHDNGIGIEDTILDKIFDPFFTTKTTGEASGIGLYLSHDVVQNYGGDITVKSVKNEFTDFTITLPAIKE